MAPAIHVRPPSLVFRTDAAGLLLSPTARQCSASGHRMTVTNGATGAVAACQLAPALALLKSTACASAPARPAITHLSAVMHATAFNPSAPGTVWADQVDPPSL